MTIRLSAEQARRLVLSLQGLADSGLPDPCGAALGRQRRPADRAARLPPARQHQHGCARPPHDPVRARARLSAGAAAPGTGRRGAPVRALDGPDREPATDPLLPVLAPSFRPRAGDGRGALQALVRRRFHARARAASRPDPGRGGDPGARSRGRAGAAGRRLVGLARGQDRARVSLAHRPAGDCAARWLSEGLRSARAGDPGGGVPGAAGRGRADRLGLPRRARAPRFRNALRDRALLWPDLDRGGQGLVRAQPRCCMRTGDPRARRTARRRASYSRGRTSKSCCGTCRRHRSGFAS